MKFLKLLLFPVVLLFALDFLTHSFGQTIGPTGGGGCTAGATGTFQGIVLNNGCATSAGPGEIAAGGSDYTQNEPNNATGTGAGLIAKLTSTGVQTILATDTNIPNYAGICVSGCSTSGNAKLAIGGFTSCVFDGSTTLGDYVIASTTTAGECHDNGSVQPTGFNIIGFAAGTNVGAGTYLVDMNVVLTMSAAQGGGKGQTFQTHGDSNFNIPATGGTYALNATLTATRTWTLPSANAVGGGTEVAIVDVTGGINGVNTISVSRKNADTIEGGTTISMGIAYNGIVLVSDGVSHWTLKTSGFGTGSNSTYFDNAGNLNIVGVLTANGPLKWGGSSASTMAAWRDASGCCVDIEGNSGQLLVGNPYVIVNPSLASASNITGAAVSLINNTAAPELYVVNNNNGSTGNQQAIASIAYFNASSTLGMFSTAKSRSSTIGTHSVVQTGDNLGLYDYEGDDGTNFQIAVALFGQAEGTIGAGQVPGRLLVQTANASGTRKEAFRLNSAQHHSFGGGSAPNPTVTSCGSTPNGSVDANATDSAGTITIGGSGTTCTVTFATAFVTYDHCQVTSETGTAIGSYSYSLSAISLTSVTAGDKYDYSCEGI